MSKASFQTVFIEVLPGNVGYFFVNEAGSTFVLDPIADEYLLSEIHLDRIDCSQLCWLHGYTMYSRRFEPGFECCDFFDLNT